MRGWLFANLFLLGMAVVAAGILFGGAFAIRVLEFDVRTTQILIGFASLGSMISAGLIGRATLRRIERRR
jgi:hypothetical protein